MPHAAELISRMPFAAIFVTLCLLGFVALLGAIGGLPMPVAKAIMTQRETAMFVALEQVLPTHQVHAHVAMGALLVTLCRPGWRYNMADRNAFSQEIVDFVMQTLRLAK